MSPNLKIARLLTTIVSIEEVEEAEAVSVGHLIDSAKCVRIHR